MSKIIKTVGKIVATALLFVSGMQVVAAAILVASSIGASLLAKKPKPPEASPENYNRLRADIDPRTKRKTCVGITALATDIRDEEFTDDQAYFHRFIVVASHKTEAIDEIWFDDKQAWTSGGGVQGEFVGYLTVATVLEGSSANAINISARMGTGRRYTGLAYVHLTYKLTGNSDGEESPFAQNITTRITIRGKGAWFYDPRLDSTVDGGSGSHRADDQSTWEWDADACRNPALALLFYLLGWRITNPSTGDELLAVGKGIPQARIDLESFAVAANICDESVSKVGGGTEPRYRCDGVWSEGDDPTTVIDMLKSTMNADLDDVDGKIRLTIFKNDLASPIADFDDDDVLDDFQWTPCLKLEDTPNVIMGHYVDASDDALYQPVDYPQISYDSPDDIDRIDTFNLPMVQSVSQAQRLAALRLLRQAFSGIFVAQFQATAWAVQKNDIIRLTFAPLDFTNKLFRVAEMELREDGIVPLVLREEHEDIYETPSLIAALTIAATTPYDPSLNAIVAKLNTVETDADITSGIVGPAETLIACTHSGTIKSGQINPRYVQFSLLKDGDDRTEDATWSRTIVTGVLTAPISDTAGSKGQMNITALTTDAVIVVTAVLDGRERTYEHKVTRVFDAPPVTGTAGGSSANDSISGSISSSSLVALGPELIITVGTGGQAVLSADYTFNLLSGSIGVAEPLYARWYHWNGSAYVAIGSEVQSSQSASVDAGGGGYPVFNPGWGACNYTHTGLSSLSSQKYRLYARGDDTNTRAVSGSCSAVGS